MKPAPAPLFTDTETRPGPAAPSPARATHRWTPAQLDHLRRSANPAPGFTLRDLYAAYRRRFTRHAATFNQFRTRRYVLLHPQVGRDRARRHRETRRLLDKLATVHVTA